MKRIYLTEKKHTDVWKAARAAKDAASAAEAMRPLADLGLAPGEDVEVVLTRPQGSALAGKRLRTVDDAMAFLKGAPQDVKDAARDDLGGMERIAMPVVITDESEDRDRDVVVAGGGDLTHYKQNPVMLFGHDHGIPAIGNGFGAHPADDTVRAIATFNPEDVDSFGFMVGRMFEERIMRALSIGFLPKEWSYEQERGPLAMRFLSWELIEFSAVNVPSNRNALVQARGIGIDVRPAVRLLQKLLDGGATGNVEQAWRLLAPERAFSLPALEAEASALLSDARAVRSAARGVDRGAIGYGAAHRRPTPVASRGAEWDGPGEVSDADVDDLRAMCAWFDSEAPDLKTSYKLPHHRAGTDHTLVWRGLTAAMGALLGARGGVDIPAGDRRGVYNHLSRHYRDDFDAEPPELRAATEAEAKAIAEAPFPSDAVDWLGVAVALGRESGADSFARAVRASTYGRTEAEQAEREKDAAASQAGADDLLREAEADDDGCGDDPEEQRAEPTMDNEPRAGDDGARQEAAAQPQVDLERILALAERRLA